jgi:hypothetical protein
MAKNKISEFSSTPANNTDIGGINIAEGCAPSGINNAIRELMAQLKDQQAGTDSDSFTVGGGFTCAGAAVFSSTVAISGSATAPTPSAGDSSTKIATTAFLASMYPVGSIYTSTASTNPNTLFGFGTWVAFGAGRVMVGNGGGFTAGATGGSADAIVVSHTHTAGTVENHRHLTMDQVSVASSGDAISNVTNSNYVAARTSGGTDYAYVARASGSEADVGLTSDAGSHSHTITTEGSSGTNANLQPYIVVYMWNRTA